MFRDIYQYKLFLILFSSVSLLASQLPSIVLSSDVSVPSSSVNLGNYHKIYSTEEAQGNIK